MIRKNSICFNQSLAGTMSKRDIDRFVLGCSLYEVYTYEGWIPISKKKTMDFSHEKAILIIDAILKSNLNLKRDMVAKITLNRLLKRIESTEV